MYEQVDAAAPQLCTFMAHTCSMRISPLLEWIRGLTACVQHHYEHWRSKSIMAGSLTLLISWSSWLCWSGTHCHSDSQWMETSHTCSQCIKCVYIRGKISLFSDILFLIQVLVTIVVSVILVAAQLSKCWDVLICKLQLQCWSAGVGGRRLQWWSGGSTWWYCWSKSGAAERGTETSTQWRTCSLSTSTQCLPRRTTETVAACSQTTGSGLTTHFYAETSRKCVTFLQQHLLVNVGT